MNFIVFPTRWSRNDIQIPLKVRGNFRSRSIFWSLFFFLFLFDCYHSQVTAKNIVFCRRCFTGATGIGTRYTSKEFSWEARPIRPPETRNSKLFRSPRRHPSARSSLFFSLSTLILIRNWPLQGYSKAERWPFALPFHGPFPRLDALIMRWWFRFGRCTARNNDGRSARPPPRRAPRKFQIGHRKARVLGGVSLRAVSSCFRHRR